MTKYMDYMISSRPIRTFNCVVDSSKQKIKSLTVINAGHLPGRTLQRQEAIFSAWAFVVITEGSGYYQVNGGVRQKVEAGNWFCLFPNAVYNYGPDDDGYWDEYYFAVEGDRVDEWQENWLSSPSLVHKVTIDDALLHKMEMMFMLIDSGIPSNLDRVAMSLEPFVYELVTAGEGNGQGTPRTFVLNVIEDLSRKLYLPLDPNEIANRHHISVSTLRRIVHEYSGYPLNEFIHRLKAAEARDILLNTELTVKEIGESLGYKDTFYFSRVFKRITGVSPTSYRNRIGQ
ncbi:AraC family transcriptional regulator [Paenibacillus crassostreae]|uniref:Transcriptional regulator n=1 Tax=Paenibacillus crassostreae TaxID=1763538 RepID=A0A167GIN4_9BACL|nr:helix-turn-helix domain-containing protein [Paenibacillus crassostreae]AOZ92148.1 AraC family transcriptional regulator [Paenibacillus crassostreae]OAB77609.1 transcriptional regulator [Paenibacillus crassostreae]